VKWIRNPGLRITCATKLALHAFGGVAVFETRFTQEQTVAYTQGATLLHVLFRAVLQNRNGAVRPKCIPTDKIKKNWTLKKGWELFLDKKHFIIPVRTGRGSEKSRGSGVTPSAWGNGFSASCTHLYTARTPNP